MDSFEWWLIAVSSAAVALGGITYFFIFSEPEPDKSPKFPKDLHFNKDPALLHRLILKRPENEILFTNDLLKHFSEIPEFAFLSAGTFSLYLGYCLSLWYQDYYSPKYNYSPRKYENALLLIDLKLPVNNIDKFFEELDYGYLTFDDIVYVADKIEWHTSYPKEVKRKYIHSMYDNMYRYEKEKKIKDRKINFMNLCRTSNATRINNK